MKALLKTVVVVLIFVILTGGSYVAFQRVFMESGYKPRILVVLKSKNSPMEFWRVVGAGIDTAAKEFDVNMEVRGASEESDIAGQIEILEQAIIDKPDVIVLAAADYNAIVPVAEKIKEAGIILITIDSGINSDHPESFIATDNIRAGKKMGEILSKLVSSQAKIAIVNHVKVSATAIEREEGVKQGLTEKLKGRIGGIYYSNGSEEKAYEITKDILTRKPDIGGIAALNEPTTLGVARAIKELRMVDRVKLVGFDSSIFEIKLIEEDAIQATVVQKPFNMGYLGIKTAVLALKGERVDKRIDTGSEVITKENMYTIENQKLLFPFVER